MSTMTRPRSRWLALGFVALAFVAGCKTEIRFRNNIPGATIENARWLSESGNVYAPDDDNPIGPGETSDPISIYEPDDGDTGTIQFDLVVEGRKVALITDRSFVASAGEDSTFTLGLSTTARNRVASEASTGPGQSPAK